MFGKTTLIGTLASALLALPAAGTAGETALERALDNGARQLGAEEIAERLVGKTVRATSGGKEFLFHYSEDNVLSGKLIGGDWSDTGYYGITDDDRLCLSMSKDEGRLRCVTLLRHGDGSVKKYNVDGDMSFELLEFHDGKVF